MNNIKTFLLIVSFALMAMGSHAQVSLTEGGKAYTENFNTWNKSSFPSTWEDNKTIPNWYACDNPGSAPMVQNLMANSNASGAIHAYGNSNSDRSLGLFLIGSNGRLFVGLRMKNNTGKTISSFKISYRGEQWISHSREIASSESYPYTRLGFRYYKGATATAPNYASPTDVSALDFVALKTSASIAELDGNASGNYKTVSGTVTVSGGLAAGQEIMFIWWRYAAASTPALSIDDLSITPIIEGEGYVTPQNMSLDLGESYVGQTPKDSGSNTERLGNLECWIC